MDKDYEDQISSRCEKELLKNNIYIEIQKKMAEAYENNDIENYSELSLKTQLIVQTTCYRLAVKDLFSLVHE